MSDRGSGQFVSGENALLALKWEASPGPVHGLLWFMCWNSCSVSLPLRTVTKNRADLYEA